MDLPTYIELIGDEAAARLFNVKKRRVESWRRRERYPRREQGLLIVQRTSGVVTLDGIYTHNNKQHSVTS